MVVQSTTAAEVLRQSDKEMCLMRQHVRRLLLIARMKHATATVLRLKLANILADFDNWQAQQALMFLDDVGVQ
jgi:hypothetical protein